MLENFFHDKNIIIDILEETEKEQNKKIIDVLKNIYADILTDNQISEITAYYPIILLDSYAKDRGQKFDILDREGLRDLVGFIYQDRTKMVVNMVLNRLGFNAFTALNAKNKEMLKKELKNFLT